LGVNPNNNPVGVCTKPKRHLKLLFRNNWGVFMIKMKYCKKCGKKLPTLDSVFKHMKECDFIKLGTGNWFTSKPKNKK